MRLIHCADIHLGSSMKSNMSLEKAKLRREELMMAFIKMITYAEAEKISIILIAGDLFDDLSNNQTILKRTMKIIASFPAITFFYVRGNHDELAKINDLPGNLVIFSHQFSSFCIDDVCIGGIEQSAFDFYQDIKFNQNQFNILLLHANVTTSKSSVEDINLSDFKNRGIDYLALGHIHSVNKYQIDNRGVAYYCGCLEGRGFDEVGAKGFLVVDIENKNLKSVEFIQLSSRVYHEITLDISGISHVFDFVMNKMKDIPERDIVKVILKGEFGFDTNKDIDVLVQRLNEIFFYAKVYDETKFRIDYKDYINDVSLQGEFVRLVMNDDRLGKEEQEKIAYYGIKALLGEDL